MYAIAAKLQDKEPSSFHKLAENLQEVVYFTYADTLVSLKFFHECHVDELHSGRQTRVLRGLPGTLESR